MNKIALKGMRFHSFHGHYSEEQSVGNIYELDVLVEKNFSWEKLDDHLENTINYEEIYRICSEEMDMAQRLIETVAGNIIKRLKSDVDGRAIFTVCIRKKHPLLGGLVDHAMVEITG